MTESKTRYHFHKTYIDSPLQFGCVNLLQIGRRYCAPDEIIETHPHLNWFELTVVTSGVGTVVTNGERTGVRAGDLYLSFPCDLHGIHADEKSKLEYDFFSFSCMDEQLANDLKRITQNHWGGKSRVFRDEKISHLIQCALSEFLSDAQPYCNQILTDTFRLILAYLIRDFNNTPSNTANVSDAEILCFQLMNYLDTHIYSIQKLEEVGAKFNYNYGYLSGLFKRTTGKTLSEYYQHRKMEISKALLLENKKKVGEIAEMLGYTLYSFSKAFKAKYGVSPKAIQQNGKRL